MKRQYWLMKSEPLNYSISDLEKDNTTLWTGVRNYQARNFMMKNMRDGDEVLFYHSNSQPSGIIGQAIVCGKAVPDPTQFDKRSPYYDEKSNPDNPRWFCVFVKYRKKWPKILSLEDLKSEKELEGLLLLKKGQRLSILPISPDHFKKILSLVSHYE